MLIGVLRADVVKGTEHFSFAMMQLGYDDGEYDASYLELARFLSDHNSNTQADLTGLGRAERQMMAAAFNV